MDMSMMFVVVALVLGPGPSSAAAPNSQSSTAAFLADYLGNKVRVTDTAGTQVKGALIAVRDDEIDVLTKAGTRTVNFDSIASVERRGDSVKDGLWKGALIGAAWGVLTRSAMPGIALCVFNGVWIGVLADALHRGWTPVSDREETRPVPRR